MSQRPAQLAIDGGLPVRAKEKFLTFGAPHLGEEEYTEIADCLQRRWLGTGPKVARFEKAFAEYKQARHAVAVSSCSAALHLAMLACRVGPGDEVITTAMTFCATVNAILHTGATPVLADCDRFTGNIDPDAIEARITPRTRAVLIVHFAGRACPMDRILALVAKHGILLIEDCAHAIETTWHGRPTGTLGVIGCFSFYATKNITTGEGGMIVTNDAQIASAVQTFALHGMNKDAWRRYSDAGYRHYDLMCAGYKYNMMDLQAAIGIHQLARIEASWNARQRIWAIFSERLAGLPCTLPPPPEPDSRHALHLYSILIDPERLGRPRDWVLDALAAENIGVGVHYIAIADHPFYQRTCNWKPEDFPNAVGIGRRTISLPLSAGMTVADAADVCEAVVKVLAR